MKKTTNLILKGFLSKYPILVEQEYKIHSAFKQLYTCFKNGGSLYLCGNGGSSSDCEHIAGELLKSFRIARPLPKEEQQKYISFGDSGMKLARTLEQGLPVYSLCGHPAFSSAFCNDNDPYYVYAQLLNVWGNKNDMLLAISTSGNAKNCLYATMVAKTKNMSTLLLTGKDGGEISKIADISIIVPANETYIIQEVHLPLYHCLCAMLEQEFYGE